VLSRILWQRGRGVLRRKALNENYLALQQQPVNVLETRLHHPHRKIPFYTKLLTHLNLGAVMLFIERFLRD
jgi:hypothetical protein